jgi:hypothetical protein
MHPDRGKPVDPIVPSKVLLLDIDDIRILLAILLVLYHLDRVRHQQLLLNRLTIREQPSILFAI